MSLSIREMQIKPTVRYHLTPVRMAKINKSRNDICWRGYRKGEPSYTVGGMQAHATTLENSMEKQNRKLKIELPYDPAIALYWVFTLKIQT